MKRNKLLEDIIRWRTLVVLLSIVLGSPFAAQSTETNISGIADYKFDSSPQEIKPKMYNWEITLGAADSTNGIYEIIQITRRLDINGEDRSTTNVLIDSKMIVPNEDGIIHFKLYVGDKEPKQNMNGPGKIGQPIIFSGIGTGKGASDWIVLSGSKVDQVVPSDKGTQLTDGRLNIIQFIVTDDTGEKFQADVILRRK
jgi:hypothetical protein